MQRVTLATTALAMTATPEQSPGVASQLELGTSLFWVAVVAVVLYALYRRFG
ncbi:MULTISPECIES: hypothetical protein [Salinibaculum]|uniref:hypothetical protein n=1 Tax=Salinibaculum TaxID=2732368 RepID=UPI0030CE3682